MPRYEFVEGASSKFWEIELEGSSFTTTYGKIGGKPKSTTKEFSDAAEAQKEHDKAVKSKTKKGYVLVEAAGEAAASAKATAFRLGDLEQLHEQPFDPGERFMGLRIEDFEADEGLKNPSRVAWRLHSEGDEFDEFKSRLDALLADKNAAKVKALVIGQWSDEIFEEGAGDELIPTLAGAASTLTGLRALWIGDVHADECEMSWQHTADVAPILEAYPALEHLRVRGNPGSCDGTLKSDALRSLQFEGSNMSRGVVQQIGRAQLPNLEFLEVWLGPEDDYAEQKEVADLTPVFSGKLFPNLKTLCLRNSLMADDWAAALASSPLLEQLEVLDLSLGSLTAQGAEALLASPALGKLKSLVITPACGNDLLKKLRAKVDVTTRIGEDDEDMLEDAEDGRYTVVGE